MLLRPFRNPRHAAVMAGLALVAGAVWISGGETAPGTWSERGPFLGGRLDAIVMTSTGGLLIAGSPGGGIYRSWDQGATWMPASPGLGDNTVVHLAWDAVKPDRLYAVTWNGLYASIDFGLNWTGLVGTGGAPVDALLPMQFNVVDPKPFAQLKLSATQAAVLVSRPCQGLFYSFDGVTFTPTGPVFPGGASNEDNCIGTIAADPVSHQFYFSTLKADGQPAHVFRNPPGCTWTPPASPCLSWVPASGSGPTALPVNTLVAGLVSVSVAPQQDDLVALMIDNAGNTLTYLTTDGGSSWTFRSSLPFLGAWPSVRALVFSPLDQSLFQGNVLAYHSKDLGLNWGTPHGTPFKLPLDHADVRAIYIDPALAKLWTVTDGGGPDGALYNLTRWSWTPGSAPANGVGFKVKRLPAWQVYYAAVVPPTLAAALTRRVFIGTQDNAGLCSDDTGLHWTTAGAPTGGGAVQSGDHYSVKFAPSSPNRAYMRTNAGDTFQRTSNAQAAAACADVQWQTIQLNVTDPPRYVTRNMTAVHPLDPDWVAFARLFKIGVSKTGGTSFVTPPSTLPNGALPTVVLIDALGVLYAGSEDHGAYRCTDTAFFCNGQPGSGAWQAWGLNVNAPKLIGAIRRSPAPANTWWMAASSGLYRRIPTVDPKCAANPPDTWCRVFGGNGVIVNDVAVDPACPTRVYAALGWGGERQRHRGGILVSASNGGTWSSLTGGHALHQAPVTDVEVDAANPNWVYAASFGRGFWAYDWGGAGPACSP
jgi:hypothetical protein